MVQPFCLFFHWCFFQLIVLLKPGFNCFNSFELSSVAKVIAETWHFVSAIENVALTIETITQLSDQNRIILVSQCRCFNDPIVSTSFLPLSSVWPIIFVLELKDLVGLASLKQKKKYLYHLQPIHL